MGVERRTPELLISEEVLRDLVEVLEPGAGVVSASRLSGGLANTNYRVETRSGLRVLRLVTRSPAGAEKEALLLESLAGRGVPVPRLLGRAPAGTAGCPAPALWQELLPGETLEAALPRLDARGARTLGEELGRALALVHERRFASEGDLVAEEGRLVVRPWSFPGEAPGAPGSALQRFLRYCLERTPAGARLGALGPQVAAFLARAEERWAPAGPCLVHADFKPCNLFVEEREAGWALRGILDWEFAHAGSPFSDYGNLFRARRPALPEGFEGAFAAGLRAGGVELPDDWALRRASFDLTSALDFLSSERELPERHTACLAQVRATLALPLAPEEG